jgi:hypothetical protein
MSFLVKVVARTGNVTWLSNLGFEGLRTLVSREKADEFRTRIEALTAIAKLPRTFDNAGFLLSVVSAQ